MTQTIKHACRNYPGASLTKNRKIVGKGLGGGKGSGRVVGYRGHIPLAWGGGGAWTGWEYLGMGKIHSVGLAFAPWAEYI